MQKTNYEKEVVFSATHTTSPYWVRFKTPEQSCPSNTPRGAGSYFAIPNHTYLRSYYYIKHATKKHWMKEVTE